MNCIEAERPWWDTSRSVNDEGRLDGLAKEAREDN